jgi:protease-4
MSALINQRRGSRPVASTLLSLALLLSPTAWGQDLEPEGETAEELPLLEAPVPWRLSADQEGFDASVDHAAGLGFQEGVELGLALNSGLEGEWSANSVLLGGSARLGPLGLGVGWITPTQGNGGLSRLDAALALRLSRQLALGVRTQRVEGLTAAGDEPAVRAEVSSTWRPSRAFSFALAVEDVNEAKVGARSFHPYLTSSLSIRPGSERVAFGAEGGVALNGEAPWRFGGALRFMVTPGLEFGGYGRYVTQSEAPERVEWGAFLAMTQRNVTTEASLDRRDPSGDPDASSMGVSSLVRWTSRTAPALLTGAGKIFVVTLEGAAAERPSSGLFQSPKEGWAQQLLRLNAIAGDSSIAGVHVELQAAPGWAQTWELRRTLARLKAARKHISVRIAWADMRALYLASVADQVYGQPAGGVESGGLAITRTYLADLLSRLGIRAQFVAIGDYKSSPDALTRTGPTDADIEQTKALLDDFESEWVNAVSRGRGMSKEAVRQTFEVSMKSMATAHESGLVDRVVGDHELKAALEESLGQQVQFVHSYDRAPEAWRAWSGLDTVAVVPVLGTISAGGSTGGLFSSGNTLDRPMVKLLNRLREDSDVSAVVLRIDSPGGGVVASDRIYEAVRKLAASKPVVVSMGDVAASGGYYIACGAKKIFATPLTVTGSIGIFAGKVHAASLFERVGLAVHTERSAPHADQRSLFRPFDEGELASLRTALGHSYDRFVGLVSRARGLTLEEAKARSGGRIYSGARARKERLVDAEGSLWDAIEAARHMSGAGGAVKVSYVTPTSAGAGVFSQAEGALVRSKMPGWVTSVESWLTSLESLRSQPLQARLPFHLDIR